MTNPTPRRGTFSTKGRRLLLALCVTALGVGGTVGRGVPAAFAAPDPTTLAVALASGTYGGTTNLLVHLTSGGFNVPLQSVDFQLGGIELGTTTTDANGLAFINNVSIAGNNVGLSIGDVTASFAGNVNFDPSSGANDLMVSPAPLTITADNQTKVYGAALPTLTANYTGFVNGDTAVSLDTAPTLITTATTASHVAGSPYSITASAAVDPNYTISYVDGTLAITAAPLTITANDQAKAYGDALPSLTASFTGFVNGDTSGSLATQPTITTTATAASSVAGSPYAITASGAVDTDYSISYVAGSLTVTAAPLTITANDQTNLYGQALPTLTASYSGFVNGDTSTSLDTQPTITTTATAASHVSGNPYSITASGAVDDNYTISYIDGNLTVTPTPLLIVADDQSMVYGAAVPPLTASYFGLVNGDTSGSLTTQPTCTTPATSAGLPGPYAITCSGAADPDYTICYLAGTVTIASPPVSNPPTTITKQTPVLTWATPAAITFGTALGTGQLNAATTVPGTFTYSSPVGSVLAVGTYLMTVLFTPSDTVDYNPASALVYLTVVAARPVAAPATTVPATPSPTPVVETAAAPLVPAVATATVAVTTSVTPVMIIHNQRHTIVGGLTTTCSLSRNLALPFQPGCVTVSTVWLPGAKVTYTITYPDGTTQQSTDTADARGHSLQVFAVHYLPPVGTPRGSLTIAHITAVGTLGTRTAQAGVRFAAIR